MLNDKEIRFACELIRLSNSIPALREDYLNPRKETSRLKEVSGKISVIHSLIQDNKWEELFKDSDWLNLLENSQNLNSIKNSKEITNALKYISTCFPEETEMYIIPEIL
jgi:hypothetical protein